MVFTMAHQSHAKMDKQQDIKLFLQFKEREWTIGLIGWYMDVLQYPYFFMLLNLHIASKDMVNYLSIKIEQYNIAILLNYQQEKF